MGFLEDTLSGLLVSCLTAGAAVLLKRLLVGRAENNLTGEDLEKEN